MRKEELIKDKSEELFLIILQGPAGLPCQVHESLRLPHGPGPLNREVCMSDVSWVIGQVAHLFRWMAARSVSCLKAGCRPCARVVGETLCLKATQLRGSSMLIFLTRKALKTVRPSSEVLERAWTTNPDLCRRRELR